MLTLDIEAIQHGEIGQDEMNCIRHDFKQWADSNRLDAGRLRFEVWLEYNYPELFDRADEIWLADNWVFGRISEIGVRLQELER